MAKLKRLGYDRRIASAARHKVRTGMTDSTLPTRRDVLRTIVAASSGLALSNALTPTALAAAAPPDANWNNSGPYVLLPEKAPLIQLTDRPVQLETPRHYFSTAITPNAAFYVRWHLDQHPRQINLSTWRLQLRGAVQKPLAWSFDDLLRQFAPVTVSAVNQCSGNSRSRFTPRVQGSQWGNGAMGCASYTGVRLRDMLQIAKPNAAAVVVQFQALDRGMGPPDKGAFQYLKSLPLHGDALDNAIIAYAQNGAPLPLLNGFPVRVIVPGYFSTYWVKALSDIVVLDQPDQNYWMKTAYLIPDTPDGSTTPEQIKAGIAHKKPIAKMPVRSFIVTPEGSSKIPAGFDVAVQGIAFSGHGSIRSVEFSIDNGLSWKATHLDSELSPYAFRVWRTTFRAPHTGEYTLACRATDVHNNQQSDVAIWNPGGYMYSRIERQKIVVGQSA